MLDIENKYYKLSNNKNHDPICRLKAELMTYKQYVQSDELMRKESECDERDNNSNEKRVRVRRNSFKTQIVEMKLNC